MTNLSDVQSMVVSERTPASGQTRFGMMAAVLRAWRTLGSKDVIWTLGAATVGALCCVIGLIVTATSLAPSSTADLHQRAERTADLNRHYAALSKALLTLGSGAARPEAGKVALIRAWDEFAASITDYCAPADGAPLSATLKPKVCVSFAKSGEQIGQELLLLNPPARRINPSIAADMLALGQDINDIRISEGLSARLAVKRLVDDYSWSIVVLTLTTAGFASAGLILLFLIGRMALRASDAGDLLRETIEALPAGIVLYDAKERLILFNAMAADITPALKRTDAIGRTYADVVRESGRIREAAGLGPQETWIAQQTARFRSKGERNVRQTNDGKWIEFYEKSTCSSRTVGLRVDVTALKTHEIELERAHGRFQALVDSLADIVFSIDFDGNFTFVSAAAGSLAGIPPSQLLGSRFRRIVHPDDWPRVRDTAIDAYKQPDVSVQSIQFRLRRADGSDRHVDVRFQKVPGERLGESVMSGVIRDIDDSVQLAARLDVEMVRLRSIVESSGALIVLLDRELRISMVNHEFSAISGVAERDAIGRPLKDIIDCPLDSAILERWLEGPLKPQDAEVVHFTNTLTDQSGNRRFINVTAKPVTDDEGVVRSIVLLGVDDTARREAEFQLFDAERMKSIGELAATVAHEVNQPLQVIRMAAEAALDEIEAPVGAAADTEFAREKLVRIIAQIERATRIISEIRAYARSPEADPVGPFDPAVAVRGAIELTRHLTNVSGISVQLKLPETVPSVVGHTGRMEQVLINLINNARDALDELPMARPTRSISIALDQTLQNEHQRLRLTVEDNGPGIAPHVLPRLFGDIITTKPRGKGTGLGLPLCRRIVEEMGGTIHAANRPEGGARFEILLPVASR